MPALEIDHPTGRAALLGTLDRFVQVVDAISDLDLPAASRCHGWGARGRRGAGPSGARLPVLG